MKMYHASKNKFDAFNLDYTGSITSHANNSNLGFWFAVGHTDTHPKWIEDFSYGNGYIYKVELDTSKCGLITIYDLREMSDYDDESEDYWINLRKKFLEKGYTSLGLQEINDRIDMYIALTDDIIDIIDIKYIKQKEKSLTPEI